MERKYNRKFRSDIWCVVLAVIMLVTFFALNVANFGGNVIKVKAETTIDELDDNIEITKSSGIYQLGDEELYYALIDGYNSGKTENDRIDKLYVGTFRTTESLNLSNKEISTISGLEFFKFDVLKSLDLSNNKISQSFESFENMSNLETLNLSNNQITYFSSTFSNRLKNVDLSHNEISSCNLSTVASDGYVDISFNLLSRFQDITLPNSNATVFATHNLLTEEPPTEILCTLLLGYQGGLAGKSITAESVIKFYGLDEVASVKIYQTNESGDITNQTPVYSLISGEMLSNFPIGYYKVVFDENDELNKKYDDILLVCRPNSPVFQLYIDGEIPEKELHIIKQIATLKMEADGEIYYKINNGETKQGNEILIDKSGSYTVVCWQKVNGMDSEKVTYLVISNYVDPLTFVWIFLGIIAFVVLFYAGKIWGNHSANPKVKNKNKKGFE